jgi:anti-sigma B factor antagonist
MSLTVSSSEKTIGNFIVQPEGSLDTNTYKILENRINLLLTGKPKLIIFDLEKLDYISSMGVRTIAWTKKELKKINGSIVLLNLKPQIRKVFDIIKALPSQQIFDTMEELDEYLDIMQKQDTE